MLKDIINAIFKSQPQFSEGERIQLLETILMYQQENLLLKIENIELRTIKWN